MLISEMFCPLVYSSCTSNCTSNLRSSLEEIIEKPTAQALLDPFHHIMMETENPLDVYKKAQWICQKVDKFDLCMNDCSESFEKSTVLNSFGHWTLYCSLLTRPTKSISINTGSVIPINRIIALLMHWRQIKTLIDDALLMSFEQLLKINSNRVYIPAQCFSWRRYRLRHHGRRRKKEKEEKLISRIEENPRATTDKEIGKQKSQAEILKSTENSKTSTARMIVNANLETVTEFVHITNPHGTNEEVLSKYPERNSENKANMGDRLLNEKLPKINEQMKDDNEIIKAYEHTYIKAGSESSFESDVCSRRYAEHIDGFCCKKKISVRNAVVISGLLTGIQLTVNFCMFLTGRCGIEMLDIVCAVVPIILGTVTLFFLFFALLHHSAYSIRPFIVYHILTLLFLSLLGVAYLLFILNVTFILSFVQGLQPFSNMARYLYTISNTSRIVLGMYLIMHIVVNSYCLYVAVGCYISLDNLLRYIRSKCTEVI
uniref:Choline transporter-like protein n=1 Tax=Heterorhabditis bacteriophora TaxID=37862 RepID=A0A1I7XG54_HETBA